jgi:hypothetical protein
MRSLIWRRPISGARGIGCRDPWARPRFWMVVKACDEENRLAARSAAFTLAFGRHGSSPYDPTIVLDYPRLTRRPVIANTLWTACLVAAPTVWRVQGGTGRRRAAANGLGPCPNSAISRRRGPSRKPTPVSSSGEANSQYESIASPPPPPLLFRSLSLPAPKFARRQRRRGGRW